MILSWMLICSVEYRPGTFANCAAVGSLIIMRLLYVVYGWISAVDMLDNLMRLNTIQILQVFIEFFMNKSVQSVCGMAFDA